jgi:glycosyltransferase involved in cell wall biosynthesis
MNVCLLCREYPPADGGGIGAYMHRYAAALAQVGCTVTVVTAAAGRDPAVRTEEQGAVTVVGIPVAVDAQWIAPVPHATDAQACAFHALGPSSLFGMAVADHLPNLHNKYRFDVVESPETGAGLWFVLNRRRAGLGWVSAAAPLFVTHVFSPSAWIEVENRCPATSRGELALRWMERDAARWADAVVCSSNDLAAWAERAWDLEPGSVGIFAPPMGDVHSGEVGAANLHRRVSSRSAQAASHKRLLFVGRLEPRKGVDLLLAAFSRACERVDGLALDMVGQDMIDGRTGLCFGRRSVELHVSEAFRSRVRLVGPLGGEDLRAARRRAFAAAIPGAWDNFPYTCVEAMVAELPILGARSGGVEQLVRDGVEGALFTPGDINACADAIVTLATMDDETRHAMGESAQQRVRSICDDRTVAEQRVAHYEGLRRNRDHSIRRLMDRDDVVLVNATATAQLEPLVHAVRSGCAFAMGWARTAAPPGMVVLPTPTAVSLAVFAGPLGPLAVAREVLLALGEDDVIERRHCDDPAALVARLIEAGYEGAVVPNVHADASTINTADDAFAIDPLAAVTAAWNVPVTTPLDRRGMTWRQRAEAAEGELEQLRASRTMKLAQGLRRLGRALPVGSDNTK